MNLDDDIRYLQLYLFLYSNPSSNAQKIMERLGKKYEATNKLLNKLLEKGHVERKKRVGELGGFEWEYSLSENKIKQLKKLTYHLMDEMDILSDFISFFKDSLGFVLNGKKKDVLKKQLQGFFKNKLNSS